MASLQSITLGSGRRVAYRLFGDPGGFPVLSCHGGLMSGSDAAPSDAVARALGLLIVSPDRPGIGGSTRRPGHRMLDWARDDVTALLDRLGASGVDVSRFGVTGWSEGAQYALAVGHVHTERVSGIALVAGALPLDEPRAFRELNATDRLMAVLSARAPGVAAGLFGLARGVVRAYPRLSAFASGAALDRSDAALLRRSSAWFSRAVREGLRDAWGAVDEYHAFVGHWGFTPEQVGVPVVLHQGGADRLVPAHWALELERRLPHATLRRYPGEGHFVVHAHRAAILASIPRP
ncbi:MAG: alpha/beta hydrolase [Herbiconiux sp.]|nr:alpha/beta hydrolase [Herbiconiux sp.]